MVKSIYFKSDFISGKVTFYFKGDFIKVSEELESEKVTMEIKG